KIAVEKSLSKEIAELILEIEKIKKEIASGKISFEDAVMKYSEDPSKEETKGFTEFYTRGYAFYSLDEALESLAVGEISDPITTPMGCLIVKLEKEYFDLDGVRTSTAIRQIILTFDRFTKVDEDLMSKMQKLMSSAKVDLIDLSLRKEIPQLHMMGKNLSPEELDASMKEIKEMEAPETNWRDLEPDTVIARIDMTESPDETDVIEDDSSDEIEEPDESDDGK
ncbi:MAG: peptidylprolyl isomerase, partial [bacterium]